MRDKTFYFFLILMTLAVAAYAQINVTSQPFTGTASDPRLVGTGTVNLIGANILSSTTNTGTNTGDQTLASLGVISKSQQLDQVVTNSSTLVDSTDLVIPITVTGTYSFYAMVQVNASSVTAAGYKSTILFTGTATTALINGLSVDATATAPGGFPTTIINPQPLPYARGASTCSYYGLYSGMLVVTGTGSLKIQFAENAASAAQTATLKAGSVLSVTKN